MCVGTREETDMFANGFATLVGTPIFAWISSAMPSIEAQPPARNRWSMFAIWLEEKKNC
ncbi:hypothetical protein D3C83_107860 [compost metagenome]